MSAWNLTPLWPLLVLGALTLANCGGSSPPRLFVLSPSPGVISAASGRQADLSVEPGQQVARAHFSPSTTIGVIVTLPQYLDRPEVMVRTGDYEMVPVKNARWAESLPLTASRVLAADLEAALPSYDVAALPSDLDRHFDFRVAVELSSFEANALGKAEMSGRWTIVDSRSEKERLSGHFRRAIQVSATDASSIAAGLSSLLTELSSEIVPGLQSGRIASAQTPR